LGEPALLAQGSTVDQQAMDKLLAPVALYPDALLAQYYFRALTAQGARARGFAKN